jgi:hypothetical protein
MEKKIFNEKVVRPESVSFIIGKNGCHIKEITGRVRNGAYIEYKPETHKFLVSAYSSESVNSLIAEITKLETDFELNRKKYVEYRFKNRNVDHNLVTEVIQHLKNFSNSSFVEYKGDNKFILSNYKMDLLEQMIKKIETFDKTLSTSTPQTNAFHKNTNMNFRRDFKKVLEEIERLESENAKQYYRAHAATASDTFIIIDNTQDNQIEEQIDNYIDKMDSIVEIELDPDDNQYVLDLETDFIKNFNNHSNPFYQLSRDHPPNRRLSDL